MDETTEFYKQIEPEIRPLVKYLRDNGFNTFCSCGHKMTVDVDLGNNIQELDRLAVYVQSYGYGRFVIRAEVIVPRDGFWERRATVYLNEDF